MAPKVPVRARQSAHARAFSPLRQVCQKPLPQEVGMTLCSALRCRIAGPRLQEVTACPATEDRDQTLGVLALSDGAVIMLFDGCWFRVRRHSVATALCLALRLPPAG